MPVNSFQKDSWNWQLKQIQQQIGEWWELQIDKLADDLSEVSLPSWIDPPLLKAIAFGVAWVLLALLLSWAVFRTWRVLRPYIYGLKNQLSQQVDNGMKKSSEDLSLNRWLGRSQKFQEQGNYSEACRCLYMAMLQRLNDSGIALHLASRTDGEYLQLIQQLPQAQPYQILLNVHQQLCFSNAEASHSLFEECKQAYHQLETS
jgi:Domain of unknown function (DUF4129)